MGPGDHVILVLHHYTNTAVNVILDQSTTRPKSDILYVIPRYLTDILIRLTLDYELSFASLQISPLG